MFLSASWYLYDFYDEFVVGFAVWSAFHFLQYYAIVRVYSAYRVAKSVSMTALAKALFQPAPASTIRVVETGDRRGDYPRSRFPALIGADHFPRSRIPSRIGVGSGFRAGEWLMDRIGS